jgi:choline transport protein
MERWHSLDAWTTSVSSEYDWVSFSLAVKWKIVNDCSFDAVAHMTEEMPRPSKDAPQAMVAAVLVGGVT